MVRAILEKAAHRRLRLLLKKAHGLALLRKRAPARAWQADVSLIGASEMKRLNAHYRGKRTATDILSFEAPSVFRKQGFLGELVICHFVLRRQAKEHGHSITDELQVLLVHGVLHLLAFDHEKGPRQAREMKSWEEKLLGDAQTRGLIGRGSQKT